MTHTNFSTLGVLLLVACLVAIASRRLALPYAVGLVVAGIVLNVAGYRGGLRLTPDLVFTFVLPPLVFEAALHLKWAEFRREAPLILNLAFIGTLLSAAVVAGGMHWLIGWSWAASLLFGSLIAATDPVSVIALMKEQRAERRLRFIMEAESLVNDGAAAVLFGLCAATIAGGEMSAGAIGQYLLLTIVGGVACGLVVTGGLLLIARPSDDHLVELTLTVLAAYGSFALAERIGASGVLAAFAAGMLAGSWGRLGPLTERGGAAMIRFWEFAAFLANSVIFLLIGSRGIDQPLQTYLAPALVGIVLALAGRAVAIYPLGSLYAGTRLALDGPTRHLLFWGGLRGALALALALAAPTSLAEHDALVGTAFAVVAFSIFVQGLSVPALLRRTGLIADER